MDVLNGVRGARTQSHLNNKNDKKYTWWKNCVNYSTFVSVKMCTFAPTKNKEVNIII